MNVNFRDLEIYKLAKELVFSTYDLLETYPEIEHNNLVSQLRRAVTSCPLNIAEGSGGGSFKVFLTYLVFCYRSSLECEAALELSLHFGYISRAQHKAIFEQLDKFIRKLWRYMEYIESRTGNGKKDTGYFYRQQKYYMNKDVEKRERRDCQF